jgi:hypothetical protein
MTDLSSLKKELITATPQLDVVNSVISAATSKSQGGGNSIKQSGGGIKNTYSDLSTIGMNFSDEDDDNNSLKSNMNSLQLINKINNIIQQQGGGSHRSAQPMESTIGWDNSSSSSESNNNDQEGGNDDSDDSDEQDGGGNEDEQEMLQLEQKLMGGKDTNPSFQKMLNVRAILTNIFGDKGIYVMSVASKLNNKIDPSKSKSVDVVSSEVKKYIESNKSVVENMLKDAKKQMEEKRKNKKSNKQ